MSSYSKPGCINILNSVFTVYCIILILNIRHLNLYKINIFDSSDDLLISLFRVLRQ